MEGDEIGYLLCRSSVDRRSVLSREWSLEQTTTELESGESEVVTLFIYR